MKKWMSLLLAALMIFSMAACQAESQENQESQQSQQEQDPGQQTTDQETYTIGICQYMPHVALDAATQGFQDAVIAELGEENVTFDLKSAEGEASNCTSIVSGFVAADVDLIMANATPALIAAYNATETIPILGTSVTEYGVALGIEDFNGTVGSNISGTSDLADLELQGQMILDWFPETQKVGLLFCSAEANSQYQVDKVQEFLEGKGVECKQFPFADISMLTAVTQEAAGWSEVIYVPTDNTVANNTAPINDVCVPAGVPIIAGEAGICSGCGVATISIDYYDLGYTTGLMAVKVLKGEADITQMPIEYAPNVTYYYNEANCNELGITPLEGYQKQEG